MKEPANRPQSGRLAGAVRSDERYDLPLLDLDRDALESLDVVVIDMNFVDLEKSHAASLPNLVGGYGRLAESRDRPPSSSLGAAEIGLDHRRVGLDLGGRPLRDLYPMIQHRPHIRPPHHGA